MCIKVFANGNGDGACTHVSVFVYLMRGEYDDRLVWPFHANVTIQVINQKSNQEHFQKTIYFNKEADNDGYSHRVISKERSSQGWGDPEFICHSELEFVTDTRQYIKDKCMKLRVTKVDLL